MKKVLCICLIFSILLGLTACGKKEAIEKYGEEAVAQAEKAISFVDEFLNNTLDPDIVQEKLFNISDKIDDISYEYSAADNEDMYWNCFCLSSDVHSLGTDIMLFDSDIGTTTREEIREKRDNLAKEIGY